MGIVVSEGNVSVSVKAIPLVITRLGLFLLSFRRVIILP